jgi:hypothetical protein
LTLLDVNQLSAKEIAIQLIVEQRQRGCFISREDFALIDSWFNLQIEGDQVLILFEEALSAEIARLGKTDQKFSLKKFHRRFEKQLRSHASLVSPPTAH